MKQIRFSTISEALKLIESGSVEGMTMHYSSWSGSGYFEMI